MCIGAGTVHIGTVNAAQQITVSSSAQDAINAVNALYTDSTHTALSPKTTKDTIQAARKLILKAAGKCDIRTLSNLCLQVEALLTTSNISEDPAVQNAVAAVDALYTDNTHTALSPKATKDTINAAKKLILKAAGKCDIRTLSNLCLQVEALLTTSNISEDPAVQNAVAAVDALYTDNTHTALSPKATKDTINAAKKLILKAAGKCDIRTLSNLCLQAEALLTTSNISEDSDVQNALAAVNALFTDDSYTTLSPTTTIETIQATKNLISKAIGKCDVVSLNTLCLQAETLLMLGTNF